MAFIEATPYVATRETLYNEDRFDNKWPSPRTTFYSGLDLSTKFYRLFDVNSRLLDIHHLRHVIQPTAKFAYTHEPTVPAANLKGIDGIDTIARANYVALELLNKLQTKRKGEGEEKERSVDLLRYSITTNYDFKPKGPGGSKFSDFLFDLELLPRDWIRIEADATYEHRENYFKSANFDLFINTGKRLSFGVGYRHDRERGREITSEFKFKINPKWSLRIYEHLDFNTLTWDVQEYTLSRDLHCWIFDLTYSVERQGGETFLFVFRLKAFPDMSLEFSKGYHNPKPRSQPSTNN